MTTTRDRTEPMLGDAWTITRRQFWHWRAQPGGFTVGLLFPVLVTLMFGALFGGAIAGPGEDYYSFLMPGIFVMAMLFGLETTMTAVNTDASRGVTDRFRSLPIHPAAVVLGRCLADMIYTVLGLIVLMAAGLALGWRWSDGMTGALTAVALLLMLRFALLWVGIFVGLIAPGPETVVAVQILVWPISMLSNIFVDPATMPGWLGALASWNPLSATATATRELFGNPTWASASWVNEHALLLSVIWPVAITAVFAPLAVRAYRRLGG
ncbi:ABC transporter permease [Nakamurella multipartita]|jgi:ABC-2 type transport system permease protein|uniref:Transport permease protein n=1 Tax=Nakamurella multipartita (strain ATCC 700099 / DSM 44233 / CIP 104796 / JCM 9543 / NBRC 105858 / Y-104) TaxID=479431 RepID=C8XAE1_NAKMY|nr:ABC transporter permease [Nakamurella multipartita]ACV77306.1 ABC-2 type transporter [Nakamurella multipartita DSM 44233]HOZ58965.1 ABC transporter permease [Nakamurella multipartita]